MRVPAPFRARLPWVVAAVALSTLAADSAVMAARQARPFVPESVAVQRGLVKESEREATERKTKRDEALRALFDRRAKAVLARDRKAFLADVDDADEEFAKRQAEVFDSLTKLDFASWEYRLRDESYDLSNLDPVKYRGADDLWLPVLTLHYQLKDYDKRAVVRRVVYTAIRHGSRWYLANDRDLEASTTSGTSVRQDPWENGPITVRKTKNGLVIGHPQDDDAIDGIQREIESAVKHVSSYVGPGWGEKTVVILPANHEELQFVLENPDVPFEFAAIAHPEFTTLDDEFLGLFAGTRVVINPDNFSPQSSFNRLLIRHELTHVATFERTGPLSPQWLVEGLAEWVGNAGSPLPTTQLAVSLTAQVKAKGVPDYLPLDSDFGLIGEAGVGYDSGWLLCRYLASKYGKAALLRFYNEMGNRAGLDSPGTKLDETLKSVFHLDEAALLKAWRPYVRAAVGDVATLLTSPGARYKADGVTRVDAAALARQRDLKVASLKDAGMERGGEGFWFQGSDDSPERIVAKLAVVSRDETAANAVAKQLGTRYTKYDAGRPIANGRLYLVGVRIGDKDYNQAIAVIRAGILTYEIRVAYEAYGDPSSEALSLAAAQFKAATT